MQQLISKEVEKNSHKVCFLFGWPIRMRDEISSFLLSLVKSS